MVKNEVRIMEQCKGGDMKSFTHIYNHYVKKIYDFVYFKTFHRETAEDITSITFMKAMENTVKFDPVRGSVSAWLYRIATNSVIDHYRRKKTTINIDDVWDLASDEDIEVDAINRERYLKIQDYLSSLSPDKRSIIIMRVWQDLSYREISGILGKTEAQCKMTFYRAIVKLKKQVPAAVIILLMMKL